jgi:coenzyme F420 hydrogenase subunit beta
VPPEKLHWAHLYDEVVTSGLCTGCSACVVVCPYDVLGYDDADGRYKPFHVEADGGLDNCTHGVKGCTLCTRACPRFRTWEPEIDQHLFGRERTDDEVSGIAVDIVLARATDPEVHEVGQDGGFVSALLVFALEHDVIDAALVSALEGDGSSWKAVPAVARRLALHLLGQPHGLRRGHRRRGRADRPGRHGLPGLGPAGDGRPQGREGGPALRALDRAVVLEDLR